MLPVPDQKALLRRDIKAARTTPGEIERARAALALRDALWPFLSQRDEARIGVYLARPFEISLDPLIGILLEANIEVSAPRLDLGEETMQFFRLESLQDVRLGPWNVREPCSTQASTPSLALVPGLAFDAKGHRLGTGGGWYDRTLTPDVTTVGVGFDFQIVPDVPVESHDYSMNWVFSPTRVFGPFDER